MHIYPIQVVCIAHANVKYNGRLTIIAKWKFMEENVYRLKV